MNLMKGYLLDEYHLLANGCKDCCGYNPRHDFNRESHKRLIDIKKATATSPSSVADLCNE